MYLYLLYDTGYSTIPDFETYVMMKNIQGAVLHFDEISGYGVGINERNET